MMRKLLQNQLAPIEVASSLITQNIWKL